MVNKLLGIHLAPIAIKLVELEQIEKVFRCVAWLANYFPAEKAAESQLKFLTEAVKNNKVAARRAVLVLSGTDIVTKLVALPALPEKEVEAALRSKLGSLLPFPVADAVIDFYKLGELQTAEKQLFFVAALPKEYVTSSIGLLKKAGLSVVEVVAASSALMNAGLVKETAPYISVYLGKYATQLILVKHGQVVFAREVAVGGNNITQSMVGEVQSEAGRLELDYAKAETIRQTFGVPIDFEAYSRESKLPAAEILAMMRPALEKISEELLRTIAYYRDTTGDQTEFNRAFFTGGVSRDPNLQQYFAKTLDLKVEPLPLIVESAGQDYQAASPTLSLAIGAATLKKPYLSFLPEEYRHALERNVFQRVKIQTLALIYVLALGLVLGFFTFKTAGVKQELAAVKSQLAQQEAALSSQKQPGDILIKIYADLGVGKSRTDRYVKLLGDIHRNIPQGIYFRKLSYNRKNNLLVINGLVLKSAKNELVSTFFRKLNDLKYVNVISINYLQASSAFTVPTYDFEITCTLRAGEQKQ